MPIQMTLNPPGFIASRHRMERIRKHAEFEISHTGLIGRSASGASAIYAIEWCENNRYMWTLSGCSRLGYTVERGEKIDE